MPLVPTPPTELDHKLHLVVREAAKRRYDSNAALATTIAELEAEAFSFMRRGEIEYCSPGTIAQYISFSRAISLLGDDLRPVKDRSFFSSLEKFQGWLGNKVLTYLGDARCSPEKIRDAVSDLLRQNPPQLPTPANVREKLGRPLTKKSFRYSLQIISLLRPHVLRIRSRQVVLHKSVLRE